MDGTTYTVTMIEATGWSMYIGLDRELPFDFALELDGAQFASGDASFNSYSYGNVYRWTGTDLSWSDGNTVEIRLLHEVEAPANVPATGAPAVTGTTQVGETLTADTSGIADEDGLEDAAFSYQWIAGDAVITGATNSTHTLVELDEGKTIKVRVSFTDDAGNEEALTSPATDPVAKAEPTEPPAKPTGLVAAASHDSVTLFWDDPQDTSITGYVILRRNRDTDAQGELTTLVENTGTTETTYTDSTVQPATGYEYRVKAMNAAGTSNQQCYVNIDTPNTPSPARTPAYALYQAEQETQQAEATVSEPEGEDLTNRPNTQGYIAIGESATGAIGQPGDGDAFRVELEGGVTYQVDIKGESTADGTLTDPYLRAIKDSEGTKIPGTSNDDSNNTLNSQMMFTPSETGTYYIAVASKFHVGTYRVEVSAVAAHVTGHGVPGPGINWGCSNQDRHSGNCRTHYDSNPGDFGRKWFYAYCPHDMASGTEDGTPVQGGTNQLVSLSNNSYGVRPECTMDNNSSDCRVPTYPLGEVVPCTGIGFSSTIWGYENAKRRWYLNPDVGEVPTADTADQVRHLGEVTPENPIEYRHLISSVQQQDWYRFSVSQSGTVCLSSDANFTAGRARRNVDGEPRRISGATLTRTTTEFEAEPGEYYAYIPSRGTNTSFGEYTLTIRFGDCSG